MAKRGIRFDKADQIARFDRGEIKGKAVRTDEGYIRADAVVTRTGVFLYRQADGSVRRELRHPDDVFAKASLDSMRMIPITNGHPSRLVTSDNAKELQIGAVGENIYPDGRFVMAPLQITTKDGIGAIDGGRKELSLGYTVQVTEEAGTYDGEPYTHRQRNIRYNHLSLVDSARAGGAARLNLDAEDAIQADPSETRIDAMDPKLKIVTLDGIDYQASPEVAKALEKAMARADQAEADLKTKTTAFDKLEAERDDLKGKLAKFDGDDAKKARKDEMQAAVRERIALERNAARILEGDALAKVPTMDDRDVRVAMIKAKAPDANLDGKSDDYIAARLDGILEALPKDKKSAVASQRETTTTKVDGERKGDAGDMVADLNKHISDLWKPKSAA